MFVISVFVNLFITPSSNHYCNSRLMAQLLKKCPENPGGTSYMALVADLKVIRRQYDAFLVGAWVVLHDAAECYSGVMDRN